MSVISGKGITVHQDTIPTPATYFPGVSWCRLDDAPRSSWSLTTGITTQRTLHANYKSAGWKVVQDVGTDWYTNGDYVGHTRDMLSTGNVDVVLGPNEPDLNGISGAQYATILRNIKLYAMAGVPNVLLAGPQLSTWSLDPNSAVRVWWDEFVAAGGLQWCDIIAVHLYTTTVAPAILATWIADIQSRIGSRQLICTEWGMQTQWVVAVKGSFSTSNAAACYNEALAAAGTVPMCLYDGVHSHNNDGFAPLVSTTVKTGANSTIQTPTSMANIVQGMNLHFGTTNVTAKVNTVGASTVTLDATVNSTTGETLENKDENAALSYWEGGAWYGGNTGLTALGSAITAIASPS